MAKTYTAAGSAVAGEVYTASAHNVIVTDVNNLIVKPGARAVRTSNLSYTSGAAIAWQSVSASGGFDTDAMWSVSNPERLTIGTTGIYVVTLNYYITFSGTVTIIEPWISASSTGAFMAQQQFAGSFTSQGVGSLSFISELTAGEYVTANVAFTGGSSYTVQSGNRSAFSAVWIGRKT